MKYAVALLTLLLSCSLFGQNPDIDALQTVNVHRNTHLDPSLIAITKSASPVSIAVPAIIGSVGLISRDTSRVLKAVFIGECMAVSALITWGLKFGIDRPRPFETYAFIDKRSEAGSPSFPSGHTSNAFATATAFTMAYPKWYVAAPSFAWAGAVGYSRMHLGVHYPSDVIIGALVGAGSAWLSHRLNRWLFHTSKRPAQY